MRLGELCAGYGGLGMAVEEVFGATTAWFSEYDAAPSKILAHHWPDVVNYGDMTKIDWAEIEHVDIISGGTPCQDLSAAGRRAGMNEGTRSNLWVQMREAIAIQRPRYVVWENVRGAFSACASSEMGQCPGCVDGRGAHKPFLRALGRVLGDLSDLGYDCQWRGLRAADVGACHGRFRVFVLAANRDHPGRREQRRPVAIRPEHSAAEYAGLDAAQDPNLAARSERWLAAPGQAESGRAWTDAGGRGGAFTPDAHGLRGERWGVYGDLAGEAREGEADRREREWHGDAADDSRSVDWGDYAPAIARWESVMGRRAPAPTEPTGRNGGHRLSPRFTEWMMGLPDGWVTDPAIGISRNEQLKACGNGVVPQQGVAAIRAMFAAFQSQTLKEES